MARLTLAILCLVAVALFVTFAPQILAWLGKEK